MTLCWVVVWNPWDETLTLYLPILTGVNLYVPSGPTDRRQIGVRAFVRQRDTGVADYRTRSVRNSPQDGAGVNLSRERSCA